MAAATALHPSSITAPTFQPAASARSEAGHSVTADVLYMEPPDGGEELFNRIGAEGSGDKFETNVKRTNHRVQVHDLRKGGQPNLRDNGFQLERFVVPSDIDWSNAEEIRKRYYPLAEELITKATGASRVHVYDTTRRLGTIKDNESSAPNPKIRGPVPSVHVDNTLKSGPDRLKIELPDEADKLSQTPFAVIQVWRPLKGPVADSPLAVIDAQTVVPEEDLLPVRLEFPGRVGQTYGVKHNPDHRFYYVKGLDVDEALVFICYDSRSGRARFTPHTAFVDPNTAPDAPPRQSIELRSFAFWEHEAPQAIAREH